MYILAIPTRYHPQYPKKFAKPQQRTCDSRTLKPKICSCAYQEDEGSKTGTATRKTYFPIGITAAFGYLLSATCRMDRRKSPLTLFIDTFKSDMVDCSN